MNIKEELIHYSRKIKDNNLVIGPGGNTSCRFGKSLAIKPSGLDFEEITESDLVEIKIEDGKIVPNKYRPSSEYLMHLNIYRKRPEVNCVIHAHPPYTIGLSSCGIKINHIFPDSVVYLGADIPMIEYCTPCTKELAEKVKLNINEVNAIILKNHGAITVGENIKEAYLRMELLENLAYIQWIALSIKQKAFNINYLSKKNIQEILNLESENYRQNLLNKKLQ
jgi:L-fuculose-phosphate aldolase